MIGTLEPTKKVWTEAELAALPDNALVDKHTRRSLTGLGESETYDRIAKGRHPAALKLGPRCSRWRVGDLRAWLADPLNWRAPEAA